MPGDSGLPGAGTVRGQYAPLGARGHALHLGREERVREPGLDGGPGGGILEEELPVGRVHLAEGARIIEEYPAVGDVRVVHSSGFEDQPDVPHDALHLLGDAPADRLVGIRVPGGGPGDEERVTRLDPPGVGKLRALHRLGVDHLALDSLLHRHHRDLDQRPRDRDPRFDGGPRGGILREIPAIHPVHRLEVPDVREVHVDRRDPREIESGALEGGAEVVHRLADLGLDAARYEIERARNVAEGAPRGRPGRRSPGTPRRGARGRRWRLVLPAPVRRRRRSRARAAATGKRKRVGSVGSWRGVLGDGRNGSR